MHIVVLALICFYEYFNPLLHIEELAHLTEKLQQLAMTLQPCSPCRTVDEPLHTAMQQYTDTLGTTQ